MDGLQAHISTAKHQIELLEPSTQPVSSAPYCAVPKTSEFEEAKTDKMLNENVIKPARTKWTSLIVLAPKKDGSLQFRVSYQKLNAVTKRDSYPIPRLDKCIDSLGDVTVFSALDTNSEYWQKETDEADCNRTAFSSLHGLDHFVRMAFGLRNVPSTFLRTAEIISSAVKGQFAFVYFDDTALF